jgi:hypothetical protein
VSRVQWFHQHWFYVAVVTSGVVGLWGLGLAIARRRPQRPFLIARAAAIAAMLIQVTAGVVLYTGGVRPGNGFHVFYGVVIAVTFSLAYVYRSTMERSPALWYGLLLLFVMGLGLRAWANVN